MIAQLKGGVGAMRVPLYDLVSNWAYMVMAALAWNLKSWFAMMMHFKADRRKYIAMEFRTFIREMILLPCQDPAGSAHDPADQAGSPRPTGCSTHDGGGSGNAASPLRRVANVPRRHRVGRLPPAASPAGNRKTAKATPHNQNLPPGPYSLILGLGPSGFSPAAPIWAPSSETGRFQAACLPETGHLASDAPHQVATHQDPCRPMAAKEVHNGGPVLRRGGLHTPQQVDP